MPTQVDPRFFNFGNAFLGGQQQAGQEQQRNAMLDMEQQQMGLQERRQGLYEDQFAQQQQQMQAQQQQGQAASEAVAAFLESEGLPREWAALPQQQLLAALEMHQERNKPAPGMPQVTDFGQGWQGIVQDGKVIGSPRAPERANSQNDAPSGYRWGPDGNLQAIPGGPADATGVNARKGSQPLRKEFRSLPSVKAYEEVLPLLQSARKAPDTGYGDLQLIYTVGKALDPGSVVREGELALTIAAGSPLQRIIGATRFTAEKGGRLPPQSRQQIMEMLGERVSAYKQAYDRDFQQFGEYASELNMDPSLVVGSHADSAYQKPSVGKAKAKDAGWSIELIQE